MSRDVGIRIMSLVHNVARDGRHDGDRLQAPQLRSTKIDVSNLPQS